MLMSVLEKAVQLDLAFGSHSSVFVCQLQDCQSMFWRSTGYWLKLPSAWPSSIVSKKGNFFAREHPQSEVQVIIFFACGEECGEESTAIFTPKISKVHHLDLLLLLSCNGFSQCGAMWMSKPDWLAGRGCVFASVRVVQSVLSDLSQTSRLSFGLKRAGIPSLLSKPFTNCGLDVDGQALHALQRNCSSISCCRKEGQDSASTRNEGNDGFFFLPTCFEVWQGWGLRRGSLKRAGKEDQGNARWCRRLLSSSCSSGPGQAHNHSCTV